AFDLLGGAGDLEDEALGGGVDDAGAEGVGEAERLHAVIAGAAHLDHGEFALDRRARRRQVDDAVHRHQAVKLVLDLLEHHGRAAGHDGDAREMLFVLGLGDGERVDIVTAAGKQPDDAREHAGLVVDEHAQRAGLDALADRSGRIVTRRGVVIHGSHPQRLTIAKAQSRPRPRLSASSIHSMACASSRRALRNGPASTTSKPSAATSSMTLGFAAASSPATNITDLTPWNTGSAILA